MEVKEMLTSKFFPIVFLLVLLLPFCNPEKDFSYKDTSSPEGVQSHAIPLKIEKEINLDSGTDIIGFITVFKMIDDNFLIIDTIHSRQCYLFDSNGKLLKKVGGYGQGPGEYLNLLAACYSGDKIFLISGFRVNIYKKNGEIIKKIRKPFRGICNSAYAGPNGSVYALSYNRYNTNRDTIYQLNEDGELIKSFSPISGIPPVFDTYYPQTGLCLEKTHFFQFFNFKYEISLFDYEGNKIKDIKLSSPLYTPPIFKNAKVRGHKAEKKYRASFTQLDGFFNYSRGYVALLSNWKNIKHIQYIFEFWSKDFKRLGHFEIINDEYPLAVYNDRIISVDYEKETKLIFRKIIL